MALLPKQPVGFQWRGLNKRMAPHLLEPGESPDTVNTAHKADQMGVLSARRGRAKMSDTAYSGNIVGLLPFTYKGTQRLLIATDDGCIYDGAAFFAGGTPWTPSTAYGFYVSASPAAGPGASPQQNIITCAVDINGALWAVASGPSGTFVAEGQVDTYLQFDNGSWQLACSTIVASAGCGYGLTITETPTPISCNGKLKLTGIKCIATETGQTVTLSGDVRVMGIGKGATPV